MDEIGFPEIVKKNLIDKNKDKQHQAGKEVESMIMVAAANSRESSIRQIIQVIRDKYISAQQIQHKKSGLFALQCVASGLMREFKPSLVEKFVEDITSPILECFNDKDEKVRQAAVDSLLQVTKLLHQFILINFNEIFENLLNHASDPDENVKKSLQILDNMLKNIATEAIPDKKYFSIQRFMPLLSSKMKTKSPQVRSLLTSWIKCLNSIPNTDLFHYLPGLLEGLFVMLGEQNKDIRNSADQLVIDFLREVEQRADEDQHINEEIIDILIKICNSKGDNYAKLNALLWIFEYLRVFQNQLEEDSRNQFHHSSAQIMVSVETPKIKQQQSVPIESALRKTILSKLSYMLEPILSLLSHEQEEIRRAASKINDLLLKIMDKTKYQSIEFINVVPTVKEMLTEKKSSTAESALIWMRHLLQIYSEKLLPTIDDILSKLIERLTDSEQSVVYNVMEVLGSISLHDSYFDLVIDKILSVFHLNEDLQEKKGEMIIKKLCSLLNPQKVYTTICAKLLIKYMDNDVDFISKIVQTLNLILVSDKDVNILRSLLRNLKYEEARKNENLNVFETLYQSFAYNPMCTISLCFLSEEYELAYQIIISFSEVEVDFETLNQIAQLINMLESVIFVYLRLSLLEHEKHPYLLKCLYGLMMLLPQGTAFNKLKKRLKQINSDQFPQNISQENRVIVLEIDNKKFMNIFRTTRQYYQENRKLNDKSAESHYI